MSDNTGGPAFPGVQYISMNGKQNPEGMTLRDYFAAKALSSLMQTFLAKDLDTVDPLGWVDGLSSEAYQIADAMLKARQE